MAKMPPRVEISGHSPASAFFALLMCEAGWDVVWYRSPCVPRYRPFRLNAGLVSQIKRLALRMNGNCAELLRAPVQGAWRTLESRIFRFNFDFFEHTLSRWVDEALLDRLFLQIAEQSGVQIRNVDSYRAPIEVSTDCARVIAAGPTDLEHWATSFFSVNREALRVECSELWFPTGRIEHQGDAFFFTLEGALAFLEPSGEEGYVLSLLSGARYCTERAVRAIQGAGTGIPLFLRSFALMNAGARRVDKSILFGGPEVLGANLFALGEAFGTYPESVNLQGAEHLNQALRLAALLRQGQQGEQGLAALCQAWRHHERGYYQRAFDRARLWERLMYSSRGQRFVLPTAQWLPGRMREILKAPF